MNAVVVLYSVVCTTTTPSIPDFLNADAGAPESLPQTRIDPLNLLREAFLCGCADTDLFGFLEKSEAVGFFPRPVEPLVNLSGAGWCEAELTCH